MKKLLLLFLITASALVYADENQTMELENTTTQANSTTLEQPKTTNEELVSNPVVSATVNQQESQDFASAWGVGVQVGTLGIGLNVAHALYDDYLDIRGQYNYMTYNSDINGNQFKMNFNTLGALLDYKPFAGSFRFTGGLYYDGRTLTASDANVGGSISYAPISPYLGIGIGSFGASTIDKKGFLVNFDAGVMFTKSTVNFGNDTATNNALNDSLAAFPYYPVLSLGVGYRF